MTKIGINLSYKMFNFKFLIGLPHTFVVATNSLLYLNIVVYFVIFRGIDVQYAIWAEKQENCDWKRYDTKQTVKTTQSESTEAPTGITTTSPSVGLPGDISHTTGESETHVDCGLTETASLRSGSTGAADAVVGNDSQDDTSHAAAAAAQIENILQVSLTNIFFVNVHLKLLSPEAFFSPKCTKYRLAAGLCPDPLGELTALPQTP